MQNYSCTIEGCKVAETGKCLEGYKLDECPHLQLAGDSPPPADDDVEQDAPRITTMTLHAGDTLNVEQAAQVQRRHRSRTVAFVGPNDAGKTSLIASIYDLFQEVALEDYKFAGSSSLFAFERTCHETRAASKLDEAATEHTTLDGQTHFYHLDLFDRNRGEVLALLLGDRAGENYRSIVNDLSNAEAYIELSRVGTVALLVNGEQLADPRRRHATLSTSRQMVNALIEAGVVGASHRIALILAKNDAVLKSESRNRVESDFDRLCAEIVESHEGNVAIIESFSVAAQSKDNVVARRGEGVELVLEFLMGSASGIQTAPAPVQSIRLMDRFGASNAEGAA